MKTYTRKTTIEQENLIVSLYKTGDYSTEELATEVDVLSVTVRRILNKHNIKIKQRRIYTINEAYFDVIDTEEKAYFLGLLYVDGSNHEKAHSIKLSLQISDVHILESFNKCLGSNRPLSFLRRGEENPNWSDVAKLEVNSVHMSNRLTELGCYSNKTFTLKFPTEEQVPKQMLRHFVRGYFDGDGCCSIHITKKHKRSQGSANLVSTEDFCLSLEKIINQELDIKVDIRKRHKERDTTTRMLFIGGINKIHKFMKWIYTDSNMHFIRKYDKLSLIEKLAEIRNRCGMSPKNRAQKHLEYEQLLYPNGRDSKRKYERISA